MLTNLLDTKYMPAHDVDICDGVTHEAAWEDLQLLQPRQVFCLLVHVDTPVHA